MNSGRRLRIEHQVDNRIDGLAGVAAECVVQQVVEDPPVELGLAAIIGHETGGRAVARFPCARGRIAHAQCQLRTASASRGISWVWRSKRI